jgi:hypothetical protein
MYVLGSGTYYDAYFAGAGGIFVNGTVTNSAANSSSLVVNMGETHIAAGDLVAMVGVTESPENGQPMLAVAKVDASNQNGVIGVASMAMSATTIDMDDGGTTIDFAPTTGDIAPGSYLVIITDGLAPAVNVASLALVADGAIGDKLSLSTGAELGLMAIGEASSVVVGKIAGPIDEANGTIPLFIDID